MLKALWGSLSYSDRFDRSKTCLLSSEAVPDAFKSQAKPFLCIQEAIADFNNNRVALQRSTGLKEKTRIPTATLDAFVLAEMLGVISLCYNVAGGFDKKLTPESDMNDLQNVKSKCLTAFRLLLEFMSDTFMQVLRLTSPDWSGLAGGPKGEQEQNEAIGHLEVYGTLLHKLAEEVGLQAKQGQETSLVLIRSAEECQRIEQFVEFKKNAISLQLDHVRNIKSVNRICCVLPTLFPKVNTHTDFVESERYLVFQRFQTEPRWRFTPFLGGKAFDWRR